MGRLLLILLFFTLLISQTLACPHCPPPVPPKCPPPLPPKVKPPKPPVVKPPIVPKPPVVKPPPIAPKPPVVKPPPFVPKPPVVKPPPFVPKPPVVKPPPFVPKPPVVKPPPPAQTCPIDALKLGACVDVLGGLVHIGIGGDPKAACCPVLNGLLDLDAAICLCTTIRAKLLNINLILPIALQVLIDCGKTPPQGFKCPAS